MKSRRFTREFRVEAVTLFRERRVAVAQAAAQSMDGTEVGGTIAHSR